MWFSVYCCIHTLNTIHTSLRFRNCWILCLAKIRNQQQIAQEQERKKGKFNKHLALNGYNFDRYSSCKIFDFDFVKLLFWLLFRFRKNHVLKSQFSSYKWDFSIYQNAKQTALFISNKNLLSLSISCGKYCVKIPKCAHFSLITICNRKTREKFKLEYSYTLAHISNDDEKMRLTLNERNKLHQQFFFYQLK